MKLCILMSLGLLCGTVLGVAAAPVNDNFNNAAVLDGADVSVSGSNVGATKELGEPIHGENPGGTSVWWKWTAPADGSVIVQTAGSSFDTLLAAYTGLTIATLNSVASNDDAGSNKTSIIGFNVTAGTLYHIAVDGYTSDSGDIQLHLRFSPQRLQRPANDNFADRLVLTGASLLTSATNFFASKEDGEPSHADELGGASVWWTWSPPAPGTVLITTQGSDFDTLLAVYTGSVLTNLTLVASNDDVSTNDPTSSVRFAAAPSVTYQIAVDGFDGEPGHIQLEIQMQDGLRLLGATVESGGAFKLTTTIAPGASVQLQASSDLQTWSTVTNLTSATGALEWTDPFLSNRYRFYRAKQLP